MLAVAEKPRQRMGAEKKARFTGRFRGRCLDMHRENGNAGMELEADHHCQVQTKFGLGLWRFSLDFLHKKVWDGENPP